MLQDKVYNKHTRSINKNTGMCSDKWNAHIVPWHIKRIRKNGKKSYLLTVFQYFGNVRHNFASLDIFTKVEQVMNHRGMWGAEHAWYSSRITC